jgi:hypothetical protein
MSNRFHFNAELMTANFGAMMERVDGVRGRRSASNWSEGLPKGETMMDEINQCNLKIGEELLKTPPLTRDTKWVTVVRDRNNGLHECYK